MYPNRARFIPLLSVLFSLLLSAAPARAAVYTCQQVLDPGLLAGKTIWLTAESGQAPFETSGAYQIVLAADGTYSVAAAGAIKARSGTWTASRPASVLVVRFKNFNGDAVEDVLALFDGCVSCSSCSYNFFRENLPTGGQSGLYVLTDGEAPPPPSTDIGVRGLVGGGTYQAGANVSLYPTINYVGNPSTYSYRWTKDGVALTAPIPGFFSLPNATAADSGTYAVAVSKSGVTNVVAVRVVIQPAGAPPGFQGRVWTKVSDWFTGSSAGRVWFRINDGVVTMGGDKSVTRWSAGKLEQIVTNTTPGIDGIQFSFVDAVTIESGGAFNFVVRNKLYEVRGGVVTLVPTPGLSVGTVARSGTQVVFVANSGTIANGLYLWTGNELRTLVAPTFDPPGRLARIEAVKSLSFDGNRIALVAASGSDMGLFSMLLGPIPALTLVGETGQSIPGNVSYRGIYSASLQGDLLFVVAELTPLGTSVLSYERTGRVTRLGSGFSGDLVTARIAANAGRSFHQLNATALEYWENSQFERYLGPGEKFDGKTIDRITFLDALGRDLAVAVQYTDGTGAILALTDPVAPPAAVEIGVPFLAGGQVQFSVPTASGKTYVLERTGSLGTEPWAAVETINGTGTPAVISVQPSGAGGFFRVVEKP